MALIGQIRKNSWIMIVLVGLGLFGFIVMDMFSGQQSVFGSGQNTMGSINGRKLDYNEFSRAEQALYSNSGGDVFGRRNALWNYFVEESIVKDEAKALGLGVSRDELLDLEFGADNKVSPIIRQRFADPNNPRVIDRNSLNQIKQAIETDQINPQYRSFWAHQEKEIIKDRLQSKLNGLVQQGMYTPTWMAELASNDQNQKVEFAYVKVPFDEIDDGNVELTDADYQNYLTENAGLYKQDEETRKVGYVSFDVLPTQSDSANLRKTISDLIPKFKSSTDEAVFAENNYGSYDAAYVKKDGLSPAIADELFNAEVGTVVGPYLDGNAYNAVKLIDRMTVADSVRSRHILIRSAGDPISLAQAQKTIDSLKTLIDAGTHRFDSLAVKFSQDASNASKGGDLGSATPGMMVKPFNDLIFYDAEPGKVYSVTTRFGVHLVEVLKRKYIKNEEGVKVAYVRQSIIPSEDTRKNKYNEVMEILGNNRGIEALTKVVNDSPDLEMEEGPLVKANDFNFGELGSGQPSRDIIKWAFTADKGDVSPTIYTYQDPVELYENKYVIATLQAIQPAGMPTVANLKSEIEALVRNQKKGEFLAGKIGGQQLDGIANSYSSEVDTARNVNFSSSYLQGLGNEPKVIASAFNLPLNSVSKPITGNNGVYVLKVYNKPAAATTAANIPAIRRSTSATAKGYVASQLIQSMKKNVDITDNRSKFY